MVIHPALGWAMSSLEVLYWIFVSACTVYALTSGGPVEKRVTIALLAASLFSAAAFRFGAWDFASVEVELVAIDIALLGFLIGVSLTTDRFWPLWTTAFHLVGTVTHVAKLADPEVLPVAYAIAQGWWAYPAWVTVCIGTHAAQRTGEISHAVEGNDLRQR